MALTVAQKTTLKNAIAANTNVSGVAGAYVATPINQIPNNSDGNEAIAGWYSVTASPAFIVWRTLVALGEVGKTFNASELAGLTSLNTQRLQNLAAWLEMGVNPSLADVRQFFDDIFSGAGGVNTRAALLTLWKRSALRVEQIFATGTGSTASPATMGYEGVLSAGDVEAARNS